jgi:hypothetical protein
MKPFLVEITTIGIVMANDESHAYSVAENHKRDIFGDDPNPVISVDAEVIELDKLPHGWDGECIPYGGDGNTRLAELMTPNVEHNRRPQGVRVDGPVGPDTQEE